MTGLAVALALLASVSYGGGSALVRGAVRTNTASAVAVWVQGVGFVALLIGALITKPQLSWGVLLWGMAAGALAAVGVVAFYTALQNGPMSFVAPISAAGVAVPVVGGLLIGEDVPRVALAGLLLVVAGVIVIARSTSKTTVEVPTSSTSGGIDLMVSPPGRSQISPIHDNCKPSTYRRPDLVALGLAGTSALAAGVFYLVLQRATAEASVVTATSAVSADQSYPFEAAVLVALAVQAGSLLVSAVIASRHTMRCVLPRGTLVPFALGIGALDVSGDLALTYAVAVGPVALAGPLGSLDPLVAVLLATLFFGDRLTGTRVIGLLMCFAGIALVAV